MSLFQHPDDGNLFEIDAMAVEISVYKEWIRQAVPILNTLRYNSGKAIEVITTDQYSKVRELSEFASKKWGL